MSGMRQDLRPEVEPEGPPRVVALRQKVSLHFLRQNFYESEFDEPAHQEDSSGESTAVLKQLLSDSDEEVTTVLKQCLSDSGEEVTTVLKQS